MAKKNITIFEIFLQGLGLYFSNIDRFLIYMLFPILGQLAGLVITVCLLYFFANYNTMLLASLPILKNQTYANITIAVVLFPAIILWVKSFADYMIAYSAVNSMTDNMLKSERVYDFPAHTKMVTRRAFAYFNLCVMFLALMFLTSIPIFMVFGWILLVYYAFIFQIFIFEPELSPGDCFKKSASYVSGNFKRTFSMIALVGTFTYIIIPQLVLTFLTTVKAVDWLKNLIVPYISVPSLDSVNMVLSAMGIAQIMPKQVALFIVQFLIIIMVIQLLLPLRVICMCLWYKNFYNNAGAMKKIDDRILDRAGVPTKKKRKK
ncbi:TPA: hypothetical protein CPT80_05430 [Candidatus Gastranaerophilales bacterium HUM_9]|nr:MAG TPA: hypothetical protein CPT80_05430 [Candidatus Gastranaerophilales bacterium HUM_9]HBX34278.1 hypothetical protein [Cyanobacteria bacterium UBA11440]